MARGRYGTSGKPAPSGKATPAGRLIDQYAHPDKLRANNPPVGLVSADSEGAPAKKAYAYDPHLDPRLEWAGKAEHTSFEVPTVSLHVHERIDPRTIVQAVRTAGPELLQARCSPRPRRTCRCVTRWSSTSTRTAGRTAW